jgi:hypothetical protein
LPNGGAEPEPLAQLERFFAPLAPAIVDLVERHNLLLEKYYHEAPMWSLEFGHPAGGQARLDVARRKDQRLSVNATRGSTTTTASRAASVPTTPSRSRRATRRFCGI